ncbi:hypothetical protein O181_114651, partial [Austropuccinia psidii MF-1]|nr:hypothetical protein [Austropuccinia psidii MF-1]
SNLTLTLHQACWAEFLSEFYFSITHRPGHLATLPDALSHWDNIYPERGEDSISKNPINYQKMIKQDDIQALKFFAVKAESFPSLIDSTQKELWIYSEYRSILQDLGKGKSLQDYSLDSSHQLLLFKDWVVVPNDPTIQLSILQKRHDSPIVGHPGQEKTLKLVKQDFHWSGMTQFIKDSVTSCQQFSRNKNINNKEFVQFIGLNPCHSGQILINGSFHSKNVFNNFTAFGPFIHQEYLLKAWLTFKHR